MYKFKRELMVLIVFLIAMLAISVFYYGQFMDLGVDKVPIHWNIQNQPDNFASPFVACLFGPLVIVLIMLATIGMSKKKYTKVEKKNSSFAILLVAALMVCVNWIALRSALGYSNQGTFDMSLMHLVLGLVFVLLGNQFGKLTKSRWLGIRVPATLNNEEVWNRVHQKSGKLMVLSGASIIFAVFFGDKPWVWVFYIPMFVSIILMIFVIPTLVKKKVEQEENKV